MTTTLDARVLEHPLYRQAQAHLQQAEWEEVSRCLDELRLAFPDHPEVEALAQEARLRAHADRRLPDQRLSSRVPWRMLVSLLLLGVIVVGGYAIGVMVFQRQVAPLLERSRRIAQVETSLRRGQLALAAGDFEDATRHFEAALALAPNDERVQDGLRQVERGKELARRYQEAVALVQAERWLEAHSALTDLAEMEPGYRGVESLLRPVARQVEVARAFQAAEEALQAGACREAITHFETVRALDSAYERNTVEAHLAWCYLELARESAAQIETNDQAAIEALNYFNQALILQPQNPEALAGRQELQNFLEAVELVKAEDWEAAIPRLEALRAIRPDYAHGQVAEWLFTAYRMTGDQAAKAGDLELAQERYDRLLQLALDTASSSVTQLYHMLLSTGDVAAQSRDYPLAQFYYEEGLKVAQAQGTDAHPLLAKLHVRMGDVAMANGDPETAIRYYRQAVVLALREAGAADNEQVNVYLGQAEQAVAKMQYIAAAEGFKRALEAAWGE